MEPEPFPPLEDIIAATVAAANPPQRPKDLIAAAVAAAVAATRPAFLNDPCCAPTASLDAPS